jgi:hypothetical protein
MKHEFDEKIGIVSSDLLYGRAERIYLESDLFEHQGQLADFYKILGERGINILYFEIAYANNWRNYCDGRIK